MRVFITLDYELFLHSPSQDIDNALLIPTDRLLCLLNITHSKAIFFVDAGYLLALERFKSHSEKLKDDYQRIVSQLKRIQNEGHEIGLHIHPHWEDCRYENNEWRMNLKRYKLSDFSETEARSVFLRYYNVLQNLVQNKIIAFRAGGWCLEPYSLIHDAMRECGIFIDSTVFYGGHSKNVTHTYDFRRYPKKDLWRFNTEPKSEDCEGHFIEVPLTADTNKPLMYWKVLAQAILQNLGKKKYGRGVRGSYKEIFQKLFLKTIHPVSVDSFRSEFVKPALDLRNKNGDAYFCLIGHPKCFTERSYKNLEAFIYYALKEEHRISLFEETFAAEHMSMRKSLKLFL